MVREAGAWGLAPNLIKPEIRTAIAVSESGLMVVKILKQV